MAHCIDFFQIIFNIDGAVKVWIDYVNRWIEFRKNAEVLMSLRICELVDYYYVIVLLVKTMSELFPYESKTPCYEKAF